MTTSEKVQIMHCLLMTLAPDDAFRYFEKAVALIDGKEADNTASPEN